MVNIEQTSFWSQYGVGRTFWNKEDLANTEEVLQVQSVEFHPDGRYGPEWIVQATNEAGELGYLSFVDTAARHTFFSAMAAHTEAVGAIEAVVRAYETRNGNTAYILDQPSS